MENTYLKNTWNALRIPLLLDILGSAHMTVFQKHFQRKDDPHTAHKQRSIAFESKYKIVLFNISGFLYPRNKIWGKLTQLERQVQEIVLVSSRTKTSKINEPTDPLVLESSDTGLLFIELSQLHVILKVGCKKKWWIFKKVTWKS